MDFVVPIIENKIPVALPTKNLYDSKYLSL